MEEKDLEHHISSLLKYDLKYVGVINSQGRMIEHASKDLIISPEKLEMLCMGIRLQHSMQSDFDDDLGAVSYVVTERRNLKFVSMPVSRDVLFAIAQKGTDHSKLVRKVYSKQFFDVLKNHLDKYNMVAVGMRI
ncbi:MAG TPA: hypothetical protein VJR22_04885 [Candidatus Nitrosotalea sp.]|nr:hypothetical protein [Nitrososphaerota archaeon]HKU33161.1 hypothetical protein [Candidatus Nitrosotalea sp.]